MIEKEKIKLSLFANNVGICLENPKENKDKSLQLISAFNIVTGYKVNIQKSIPCLQTNLKQKKVFFKKLLS